MYSMCRCEQVRFHSIFTVISVLPIWSVFSFLFIYNSLSLHLSSIFALCTLVRYFVIICSLRWLCLHIIRIVHKYEYVSLFSSSLSFILCKLFMKKGTAQTGITCDRNFVTKLNNTDGSIRNFVTKVNISLTRDLQNNENYIETSLTIRAHTFTAFHNQIEEQNKKCKKNWREMGEINTQI